MSITCKVTFLEVSIQPDHKNISVFFPLSLSLSLSLILPPMHVQKANRHIQQDIVGGSHEKNLCGQKIDLQNNI